MWTAAVVALPTHCHELHVQMDAKEQKVPPAAGWHRELLLGVGMSHKMVLFPLASAHSNFSLVLTAQYIQDPYSKWKDKRLCLMEGCSSYFVGAIGNLLFLSTLFDVLLSLRHWINSSSQPLHTESTLDTIFCGRWWSESEVLVFKRTCTIAQ